MPAMAPVADICFSIPTPPNCGRAGLWIGSSDPGWRCLSDCGLDPAVAGAWARSHAKKWDGLSTYEALNLDDAVSAAERSGGTWPEATWQLAVCEFPEPTWPPRVSGRHLWTFACRLCMIMLAWLAASGIDVIPARSMARPPL
jgi:hypothetical protein